MAENGKKYTENDVKEAVKAVNDGRMSLRDAEQSFNVPDSTINRRYNGVSSPIIFSRTILSYATEFLLVELVCHLSDFGFGLNKNMFMG